MFKLRYHRKYTSISIAEELGIEYVQGITEQQIAKCGVNAFYALNNKYCLLYPSNDGTPNFKFEWNAKINEKRQILFDNTESFDCIKNLGEILIQIIGIYTKYIDEDVLISSYNFAIMLEDEIKSPYVGNAKLVFREETVKNQFLRRKRLLLSKNTI